MRVDRIIFILENFKNHIQNGRGKFGHSFDKILNFMYKHVDILHEGVVSDKKKPLNKQELLLDPMTMPSVQRKKAWNMNVITKRYF